MIKNYHRSIEAKNAIKANSQEKWQNSLRYSAQQKYQVREKTTKL